MKNIKKINKKIGIIEKNTASVEFENPELYTIAKELANKLIREINSKAESVESETPYKAQGILESIISILEESV